MRLTKHTLHASLGETTSQRLLASPRGFQRAHHRTVRRVLKVVLVHRLLRRDARTNRVHLPYMLNNGQHFPHHRGNGLRHDPFTRYAPDRNVSGAAVIQCLFGQPAFKHHLFRDIHPLRVDSVQVIQRLSMQLRAKPLIGFHHLRQRQTIQLVRERGRTKRYQGLIRHLLVLKHGILN